MRSSLRRRLFALTFVLAPSAMLAWACGPGDLFIGTIGSGDGGDESYVTDRSINRDAETCEPIDASPVIGPLVSWCSQCLGTACCSELGACLFAAEPSQCDLSANCYFQCIRWQSDAAADSSAYDSSAYDSSPYDAASRDGGFAESGAFDGGALDASSDGGTGGVAAYCESMCSHYYGADSYRALLQCARRECPCSH